MYESKINKDLVNVVKGMGCETCSGGCGGCTGTCSGKCEGTCKGACDYTCATTCQSGPGMTAHESDF